MMVVDYVKCPKCGAVRKLSGSKFTIETGDVPYRTEDSFGFGSISVVPVKTSKRRTVPKLKIVKLSLEKETALTLAGRIVSASCQQCSYPGVSPIIRTTRG